MPNISRHNNHWLCYGTRKFLMVCRGNQLLRYSECIIWTLMETVRSMRFQEESPFVSHGPLEWSTPPGAVAWPQLLTFSGDGSTGTTTKSIKSWISPLYNPLSSFVMTPMMAVLSELLHMTVRWIMSEICTVKYEEEQGQCHSLEGFYTADDYLTHSRVPHLLWVR